MQQIQNLTHRIRRFHRLRRETQSLQERVRALRLSLPEPEALGDEELGDRLWRALRQLVHMRVQLLNTDHLSDRELYSELCGEVLQEKNWRAISTRPDAIHAIDLSMGTSPGSLLRYLRYYADDATRLYCARMYPRLEIPKREPRPFDRDRELARVQAEACQVSPERE